LPTPELSATFLSMLTNTTAGFRVRGDDLDPVEITQLLKVVPSSSHVKGELVRKDREARYRTGGWHLRAPDSDEGDLDGQIEGLLAQFPDDPALWAHLSNRFRLDMFCGVFFEGYQGGLELDPETILALGKRCIKRGLDLYSYFGEDDER